MEFQIWYKRNPTFREDPNLTVSQICEPQFVQVVTINDMVISFDGRTLERLYQDFQGEFIPIDCINRIKNKNLNHTSMSIGDVIVAGEFYYQVSSVGFNMVKDDRIYNIQDLSQLLKQAMPNSDNHDI